MIENGLSKKKKPDSEPGEASPACERVKEEIVMTNGYLKQSLAHLLRSKPSA